MGITADTLDDDGFSSEELIQLARSGTFRARDWLRSQIGFARTAGRISAEDVAYLDVILGNKGGHPAKRAGGPRPPESYVGSRPRTEPSLTRRRQYIAIGLLPDRLLGGRAWGIYAVLAVIARHVLETGRCTATIGQLGAEAGYCDSTVQGAIRIGKALGLLHVEYRRPPNARFNLSNAITIRDADWLAWLKTRSASWRRITKRGRAFWGMIGSKFVSTTRTRDSNSLGLTTKSTVAGRPAAAKGLSGGSPAGSGPARPIRGAPA